MRKTALGLARLRSRKRASHVSLAKLTRKIASRASAKDLPLGPALGQLPPLVLFPPLSTHLRLRAATPPFPNPAAAKHGGHAVVVSSSLLSAPRSTPPEASRSSLTPPTASRPTGPGRPPPVPPAASHPPRRSLLLHGHHAVLFYCRHHPVPFSNQGIWGSSLPLFLCKKLWVTSYIFRF